MQDASHGRARWSGASRGDLPHPVVLDTREDEVTGVDGALRAVLALTEANDGLLLVTTTHGWPGSNQYHLTFAIARPSRLILELGEQAVLVMTDPEVLTASTEAVRLGFAQLIMSWHDDLSKTPHAMTWTAGWLDVDGRDTL